MKRPWLQCNHLLSAIEVGDVETAAQLIDSGFDIDTILIEGKSAISICIQRGKIELVQLLLRRGCSLSLKAPNGDYPLHLAVQTGNITLVQMLLNNRVDFTAVDLSGKTALHMACEMNMPDIAKALIQRSTASNLNIADRDGRTPLMYACQYGMKDVVECLLQKGSRVNATDVWGESPLLQCINNKNTPEMIQCLLNAGADVDHKNYRGESPLLRALRGIYVFYRHKSQFREMALLLIDCGSNLKVRNSLSQSPLHLAVCANDEIVVKTLLNAGCEVDVYDELGLNPLYYACRNANKKILDLLVKGGADLKWYNWDNLKEHFGMTDSRALIDYLIEKTKEMQSLRALCRFVIRKNFTKSIEKDAKFLPIPVSLTKYIIHFEM